VPILDVAGCTCSTTIPAMYTAVYLEETFKTGVTFGEIHVDVEM
jgi:hypothetical protein